MPRDFQRRRVYLTESIMWHNLPDIEHTNNGWPKHFDSIEEIQKFVNRITRSRFWKTAGGRPFVRVVGVSNNRNARGWMELIEIPPWAYSKHAVLHELSHSLSYCIDMHEPDHGGLFMLIYRRLVELEFGIDERRRFDRTAEGQGVSWIPRNISPNFDIGG